jgi:hypothetical protein
MTSAGRRANSQLLAQAAANEGVDAVAPIHGEESPTTASYSYRTASQKDSPPSIHIQARRASLDRDRAEAEVPPASIRSATFPLACFPGQPTSTLRAKKVAVLREVQRSGDRATRRAQLLATRRAAPSRPISPRSRRSSVRAVAARRASLQRELVSDIANTRAQHTPERPIMLAGRNCNRLPSKPTRRCAVETRRINNGTRRAQWNKRPQASCVCRSLPTAPQCSPLTTDSACVAQPPPSCRRAWARTYPREHQVTSTTSALSGGRFTSPNAR